MDISYFGETNHRGKHVRFGIRQADRLHHLYALGATGVGKSTLLKALAIGDLHAGRGFALLDPHGDLAEEMRDAANESGRSPSAVRFFSTPTSFSRSARSRSPT